MIGAATGRTVTIVGGGLAGLAAAMAAAERGLRVELFERATMLGGRAGSFEDSSTGELVDYCQHVAMGCCSRFLDFCRRSGIEDCFERAGRLHFIDPEGRQHDFVASRWLPAPLHLLPGLLRLRFLSPGDRWRIVQALRKLAGTSAGERDLAFADWLRAERQSDRAIERFWSVVVVSALGETVEHASLRAVAKVFRDGFMASHTASELILPRKPLAEIFHQRVGCWLAERGVQVHLQALVSKIEGDGERVNRITLADGRSKTCDYVVAAVSWRDVGPLLEGSLSAAFEHLRNSREIEPAAITAVHLWFDRRAIPLRHAALIGRMSQWVFTGDYREESGAKVAANGTLASARQYCQVVISAAHRFSRYTHDELLQNVREELAAIWPAVGNATVLHSRVVRQPWALFSMRPGVDELRPRQRTTITNLALAGDWTNTGWPATMEGAVRSGFQAVEGLLEGR